MMEQIGATVHRELSRFGPAAGMSELVAAWPEVVGDAIARNAWPARIGRDGTLHVATESSAWAFELAQLEPKLRERLEEAVGDAAPARMRFAVGRLPEPSREQEEAPEREVVQPSASTVETARELAAAISDEELREAVARAAALSLARAGSGRGL
jgi:hypothetical protein